MSRKANLPPMSIALAIGLLLSSLLIPLLTTPVKADPGWESEEVEPGLVGWYTSLAVDNVTGYPHISYADHYYLNQWEHYALKYASYNGTAWNIQVVDDSAAKVGDYTSLALDATGYPHISYYDGTNGDLKYASYNGTAWNLQTVDSAGDVGRATSLALDATGYPHISYYDGNPNYDLKYASYNGTAWNIQTVDDSADWVGRYTSLALDATGYPHISYYDDTNTDLKYASYNGTAWNLQLVDSGVGPFDNVGMANSLALGATGYPHISYNDFTNRALKYASYNGTAWNIQTVDSAGEIRDYTSLALDATGYPHISYYRYDNSLKYASYNGTAWNTQIVTYDGGAHCSLALDRCGYPHISHLGPSSGAGLQYTSFIPAPGLAVSKGGSAVSKLGDNITYWVNITNTGDVPLQKVSVSDSLVPGIDGLFSAILSVGASENRTYTHTVQMGDYPGPLINTVTAMYRNTYGGVCFSVLSASDNHSTTLVTPSISVSKGGPAISKVGDDVIFTITINNTGDCTLIRNSVSDNLSVSPDPNTYAPFASIPASSSVSGNFTYTVQDTDPDPLVNTVTVHYHPEGLPNDYSDNATCTVDLVNPYILVTKAVAAGIYGVGDNITYSLSINNTSTDNVTLVRDSVTDSLAGDITSLFSSTIAAGGSDNQTYTYMVKATDPDPLVNSVTAHYHPQGLPNDITDTTTATMSLAPTITSATPNQGNQVQTLNIVITGSQLNRVNAVNFGAGITVNSITVNGPTQITVNISINASAALGSRDVTVTNPTGSDTLTGGFTVKQSSSMTSSNPRSSSTPPRPTQSALSLQYINVHPNQAHAGQPVTILTNVVNSGDEAGSYNVVLKINGQVEKSRTVSVGPQGTQPVKFTVTRSQPGTYTVDIGGQRGSFIVAGTSSSPNGRTGEGPLIAAVMAVIVILAGLLIIVARRRFQGY